MFKFRKAAIGLGLATLLCGVAASAQAAITITDVSGQTVTLEKPAERIVLGEGRDIVGLALIEKDPSANVVGWMGEFRKSDPATYEQFKAKFPKLETIPRLGVTDADSFSAEKALALHPDVAIFGIAGHGPGEHDPAVEQLRAAGIPVIFVDFRIHPLKNTVPSMIVLGQVTGHEAEAKSYTDFYEQHLKRISDALAKPHSEPKVFLEMLEGIRPCCHTAGKGNLGDFVAFAGGHNIGADVLPGPLGELNLEYVIQQNPAVYVATGSSSGQPGRVAIGTGIDAAKAQATLADELKRPGISTLAAVTDGSAHSLWHNFYNMPTNIVAIDALAKWIHPELFPDLDPAKTMDEINARFLALPLKGTYAASLH
ncbi:iron complex transport system substrate-binding protein [Faunimonas pinastri]|uniref:Iron complex transport system substrate-binding protein n=1 Tax=Faunimonas pinastri TaxID=1855383 RepID=A0A1H9FWG6_9HYPH|nr:ABC transporter substrate-binding protein [Faunimonas pinastri]SEQ42194.1 iron complex transport system substrate-binding protein [Faunimonas pinastri]